MIGSSNWRKPLSDLNVAISEIRRLNTRLDQIESAHHRNKKPMQELQTGLQRVNDLKNSIDKTLLNAEKFKSIAKTAKQLEVLEQKLADSTVSASRLQEIEEKLETLQTTVTFLAEKVSTL
jgi:tetrahydromethanopterin S-methyltransferase subunit G